MLKLLTLITLISLPHGKLQFNGQAAQGGVVWAKVDPLGHSIKYNGKQVPIYNGKIYIGFGRDANINQKVFANGEINNIKLTKRNYKEQRINNLPKKMVSPPESTWQRIKKDNTQIAAARAEIIKNCDLSNGFIMPAKGIISGVYGSRRVLNGKPKRPHYGIDIAAKKGTPIIAPAAGKVTLIQQDAYYTGKTMIINHGCGFTSTFLHMDSFNVDLNDYVNQGDIIGTVGSTGRSTGPHLDWRVNLGKTRLDPQQVMKVSF